jgi:hypothetical protein
MSEDFIIRLINVNAQVIECLKWAIHNKEPECEANLRPVVEGIASVLVDMIEKNNENLTRRENIKLVKRRSA